MMSSSIKDALSSSNSWVSRAGVIVGYKPEDTMKSFLFNQNNRHCLNFDDDEMSILKLPQSEIEKALEFLSSDSDSESSSMTKTTVKQTSDISNNEEIINININTKSGSDIEIWNTNNHSDAECTSADLSNDFGDRISSAAQSKSFEEILEEKLKEEHANKSKIQRDNAKNDCGIKPKFSFLKKNAGRAAWCSNTRPSRDGHHDNDHPKSSRSQSIDTQRGRKPQQASMYSNTQDSQHQKGPVRRMKSLNNAHNVKQSDISHTIKARKNTKQGQKTVHFAATCLAGSEPEISNAIVTQVNQKAPEIEEHSHISSDDNQEPDKDLVEFELLEQIANVSISSSVASSIAMYDEENLRAKLQKFKTAKQSVNYTQDKYYDTQRIQSFEIDKQSTFERNFHNLSTCEERTENATNSSCDTDLDVVSDDNSQNTSINTTTLSEFKEPKSSISNNLIIQPEKMQVLTRKIAKQKEHPKNITQESEVEENPFQLEKNSCPTVPLKPLHVDWSFADPFHLSDSSSDDEQSVKTKNPISKPTTELYPIYPKITVDKQQSNPDDNIAMQSAKLKQWVQLLESEVKRFKSENEEIEKLKKEKEDGLKRLEEEMKVFKKFKDEEMKKFEEYKQNESKKLKKERKVFDDYQEAMKNMPNKKDRQDIDNLKSEIETLKEELSSKENRWQAANLRLKQKVEQLESENSELHSRIHALEQKRLHLQAQLVTNSNQKLKSENHVLKPKQTVTSVSQAVSMKHSNIPLSTLPREDNNNNKCVVGTSKISNLMKKNSSKTVNGNLNKPQKQTKNVSNPFSTENNGTDIRGSAASDYYTGEEENGSMDLKLSKQNTFSKNKSSDSELISSHIPNFSFSSKIDRSNEIVKDEIHHPDGIIERIYMSGSIDITYPNGSLKQISPDSTSIVVHLFNGDIKQTTPDGRVIYYYAQDQSTQTTYPNGKEEILYKDKHLETMHPSGIREIHFPDKSVKILHPDSTEETFLPNGLIIRISKTGDKEILLPNGQKEIHANGIKKRIYPDGTTKTVYLDGRQETFYASGRMRVKDKNGNLILDQYINKTNLLTSSG